MTRSELTIDLGAIRRNSKRLLEVLEGAELWAVVKANGYGHGALDVGGAALRAGASVLCVATVAEGLELRKEFPAARILVMGPTSTSREIVSAREAGLELVVSANEIPDAARCGVAIYGLSPFGTAPADDGLEPALHWSSLLAQVRRLGPGESSGYGRRFVAERPTWIGIVPVGYADGFRRDMTGTEVRVEGEPRRVVGTISMDALAVELDRELPVGTPVTLLGDGVIAEDHARVAGTINYELVCGINSDPARSRRVVVDS